MRQLHRHVRVGSQSDARVRRDVVAGQILPTTWYRSRLGNGCQYGNRSAPAQFRQAGHTIGLPGAQKKEVAILEEIGRIRNVKFFKGLPCRPVQIALLQYINQAEK